MNRINIDFVFGEKRVGEGIEKSFIVLLRDGIRGWFRKEYIGFGEEVWFGWVLEGCLEEVVFFERIV